MKKDLYYQEELKFTLRLNKPQADLHAKHVEKVLDRKVPVGCEDTLVVNYTVGVDYWGNVADKLDAILHMAEQGIIVESAIEELQHGYSLIIEVVDRLKKIAEFVPREGDIVEHVGKRGISDVRG